MKEVIIATNNAGKKREFETLFQPYQVRVLSLRDLDEKIDVEETGTTFEENAILKAETVAAIVGKPVLADDSGLEIDALGGAPGVYSARYAGANSTDDENIDKALQALSTTEEKNRKARFRCVLAIAGPGMKTETFAGSCEGQISMERRGENGFGYDPVFYIPEKGRTMAELSSEEKNAISHRGEALRKLEEKLPRIMHEVGGQQ